MSTNPTPWYMETNLEDQDVLGPHERGAPKRGTETQIAGAKEVKFRAGSQCYWMLVAYGAVADDDLGLNAYEAAVAAELTEATYWMRASDLRASGLIEFSTNEAGEVYTRPGRTSSYQRLSKITPLGKKVLRAKTLDLKE